jgi:excisionase family DNA binding protein
MISPNSRTDALLDIDQAAHRLGTQPRFMRRLVAERRIRFYKIGKHVRFHPDDLTDYIDQGRIDAVRPDERGTRAYA